MSVISPSTSLPSLLRTGAGGVSADSLLKLNRMAIMAELSHSLKNNPSSTSFGVPTQADQVIDYLKAVRFFNYVPSFAYITLQIQDCSSSIHRWSLTLDDTTLSAESVVSRVVDVFRLVDGLTKISPLSVKDQVHAKVYNGLQKDWSKTSYCFAPFLLAAAYSPSPHSTPSPPATPKSDSPQLLLLPSRLIPRHKLRLTSNKAT